FLPARYFFATFKGRLNAAKTAVIGAPKGCVERRVRLALEIAETVPVMRPIFFHRQKIPRHLRHFMIQVLNQRRRRGRSNRSVLSCVAKTPHFGIISSTGFKSFQKLKNSIR